MPEDVTPADPSTAVAPEAPVISQDAGTVPGDVTPVQGDSRPVENLAAEVHRKFGRLQQQYDNMMQYIVSQSQAHPATTPKGEPTDDELWTLAQQGDRGAFDLYMRRIASQSGQAQVQAMQYSQLVDNQLGILMSRYPVLGDASHPLTQQANSTYQALLARGYPVGRATMLEAVKTAIADRPDIVTELHTRTQPTSLKRERAQAGVTGATTREEPTPSRSKAVSPAEADLARRMGIRDPAKAKERFQQRQNTGQSSVADTLHPFIREE